MCMCVCLQRQTHTSLLLVVDATSQVKVHHSSTRRQDSGLLRHRVQRFFALGMDVKERRVCDGLFSTM